VRPKKSKGRQCGTEDKGPDDRGGINAGPEYEYMYVIVRPNCMSNNKALFKCRYYLIQTVSNEASTKKLDLNIFFLN